VTTVEAKPSSRSHGSAALVTIMRPADAQPRRVQVGTPACSLSAAINAAA
jgi:hypothetical protein